MAALQKQDGGWMSFDHIITVIDHFKLNVGSANTYMILELPTLRRLWIKKQLAGMKYVLSELGDDGDMNSTALFVYFALFGQSHSSHPFGLNMQHRLMHPNTLDRTPSLCKASVTISDHFRLSLIILMISDNFI
jgi:hypothetical protein